jgi:hypothetical protein
MLQVSGAVLQIKMAVTKNYVGLEFSVETVDVFFLLEEFACYLMPIRPAEPDSFFPMP